ncbi:MULTISPECIES: endonuclease/exonuclease/phosphatase family protein [unclassified Streptomyces]|uniref:endonuclease/exonuclease/phosphatase family protein n=1 Tax=unclassified Streptomyces TaxID=2593676 RepID=UPI002DDBFC61|nr:MULTISPECIES: endonuclease/exonuclease/phosphatase family protein [unclassified Streptomyces]WSA91613.1 endonuclease/exonuclease/phosphatase family protein [Streptomyces sp. NBC_01795]WSB75984.1 endonuclease/exonuclease/phosphatase family protein [Streptomyces sp. NBC_01775]WSS15741.1 endonuclease/exonuclease/phosphatase family protein [Streptomyces sp. NBC_01186]WSS44580.1 endonuclease/exonuclease/phosphatase family protein [Streptomyces sp. NBC_01187]
MYTGASTRRDRDEAADDAWDDGGRRRPRGPRHPLIAALSALTLAVLTVPLAVRGADADGPTPVPQLLAFLPWFLAPAWLALLGAALARRPLLLVWGLAVLAATGWYLQPYGAPAPSGAEGRPAKAQFRVLTANLKYGRATPGLLETVRRERPQILSVQECAAQCAKALRTPELRDAYPHRIISGGRGARGSALLSVYPLRDRSKVPARLDMPSAVADVGSERVRLQVAHPMPPNPGETASWRVELDRLRSWSQARGALPTVIAGDFNASQDHAAFRAVLKTGLHDAARMLGNSRTPTWPARTAPPLGAQIDHVLLSRPLVPVDGQFLDLKGTDHRAFLVNVKLF